MKWNELIEQIMVHNNGIASLNYLYQQAHKYRTLTSGDWQKTLRGVLYREVNNGKLKKIGLGVYALPSYNDKNTAFNYAIKSKPITEYLKSINDYHSTIEGMLIEIGNFFEYTTYTSDLNRSFDGKVLKELCSMTSVPGFTYSEITSLISKSDTVWFTKSKLTFPKFIFEVESTTDFTNSMFKMYQLLNFDARFILIASEQRKGIFEDRLSKEPFVQESARFSFRSFEEIVKLYFNSVEHYELKAKFLSTN